MKKFFKQENGTYLLIDNIWNNVGDVVWSNNKWNKHYPLIVLNNEFKLVSNLEELSVLFEKYPILFELMLD